MESEHWMISDDEDEEIMLLMSEMLVIQVHVGRGR